MNKETMLRSVFLAGVSSKAMKMRLGEDLYMVSTNSVYQGPLTEHEKKMESGKEYQVQGIEMLTLTDKNRVRPEVFLDTMQVHLNQYATAPYFLFVKSAPPGLKPGIWVLRGTEEEGVFDLMAMLPVERGEDSFNEMGMCLTGVPSYLSDWLGDHGYSLADFDPVITRTKVPKIPMLLLTAEDSMLYVAMCVWGSEPPYKLQINLPDGKVLDGDGYDPDGKTWKHLKQRRQKMLKGLATPLGKKAIKEAVETPVAGKVEPVAEQKPVTVETPADTLPEQDSVLRVTEEDLAAVAGAEETAVEEAAAAMVEEQPAKEAAPAEEKQQQPKQRRQRTHKAVGLDLARVIEDLSAPVESLTLEQFDAAAQELKDLRDLTIAAARRSANISNEMFKLSKGAVDKYKAVQDLFK